MTPLQSIIKEAKTIRKKNPSMEWKKAVAQASAIYASKHKGKSPVGKKHAAKKSSTKKRIGDSNIPKASSALGEMLWDKKTQNFQDEFQMRIVGLMNTCKSMGYTLPHCKTAIRFIVDEIIEFNSEHY
jgi:hypothetical protein